MAWRSRRWPSSTLAAYCDLLVTKGYLKAGDLTKLLNAPGASCIVTPGPPVALAGTSALKVWPIKDADPANAIFATSRNYIYDTALGRPRRRSLRDKRLYCHA